MCSNNWVSVKSSDGLDNYVNINAIAYIGENPISGKVCIHFIGGKSLSYMETNYMLQELINKINDATPTFVGVETHT